MSHITGFLVRFITLFVGCSFVNSALPSNVSNLKIVAVDIVISVVALAWYLLAVVAAD